MMLQILLPAFCVTCALSGSVCPPRKDIYPCTCANLRHSKSRVSTIVTCQRIPDTGSLTSIFPALRSIQMDQFHLYDSFWDASEEEQANLPVDWLALVKIKEMSIEDSVLSSCFACQWKLTCKNTHMTNFRVFNSSTGERMCTLCDTGRGNKLPWTGCLSNLTSFTLTQGSLTTLGVDLFPMAMRGLRTLDLSYNRIVKIDPNALKNTPNLVSLDLSHNAIEFIDHIFGGTGTGSNLEVLDISWNFIKTIGSELLVALPALKTLRANNNELTVMSQSVWSKRPQKLINIALEGNPFHCDCNILWINQTLPTHVALSATCATPADYSESAIRRASRLLSDRCDSVGHVGTRKKKSRSNTRRRTQ